MALSIRFFIMVELAITDLVGDVTVRSHNGYNDLATDSPSSSTAPQEASDDSDASMSGLRLSLILHKFSRGGSDRVAAYLARGFADVGIDVDLIVFCKGGEVETILTDLVGGDIPIRYLGQPLGFRLLDLVIGLPKLVRLLKSEAPDCVISTANNTAWISAIALWQAGLDKCKLILKTTNPVARSRHRGLLKRVRDWGYRKVFRRTDAIWALSAQESS